MQNVKVIGKGKREEGYRGEEGLVVFLVDECFEWRGEEETDYQYIFY